MQRIGESAPAARRALTGRQAATARQTQELAAALAATFGPAPGARLREDWTSYVAAVDGYAVTRGWVLHEPALRQTQLGAAARREAGEVRQAAAEVLAEAPRSAVAAAREAAARPGTPATKPPAVAAVTGAVPLDSLVAPAAAEPEAPDFESFAAQMKPVWAAGETVPAPAQVEPVAAPAAEPEEVPTLAAQPEPLVTAAPPEPAPQPEPVTRAPQIAVVPPVV